MSARSEWLTKRRSGIGASDVAGILGLSKWASPYSVWLSKVTDIADDSADDEREFGRRAEQMVLDWWEDKTGLWAMHRGNVIHHPQHPEFFFTADALAYETPSSESYVDRDAIAVVEAKTTADSISEWETNGVPIYYRCQVTWAMWCAELTHAFVPTLHRFSAQFRCYEVDLNAADVEFIVPRVQAFWRDYVLTGTPPPVDAHPATTAALKEQWPTPEGTLDADENARALLARLHAHKAARTVAERNVEQAENELRALLADRDALVDGYDAKGRPLVVASWRTQEAHRLDGAALRAAHPDLADEYTTTSTTRVLRVKAQGERP